MQARCENVDFEGGTLPVWVQGPEDPSRVPGLVTIPSVFGPAPDLLGQMGQLADCAFTVVSDPFWRDGLGVVPYEDPKAGMARIRDFDLPRCFAETAAIVEWTRERCNGRVAGLGICFGGMPLLDLASNGALAGGIAWHGSRMENFLHLAERIRCPLRFHFGAADPVTPPEAIEKIQAAFANHDDVEHLIHPGLSHGFSHEGSTYDEQAAQAGVDATRALLQGL